MKTNTQKDGLDKIAAPWRRDGRNIVDATGGVVCSAPSGVHTKVFDGNWPEQADRAIMAVNTHEELVTALEIAMQELEANKVAMIGPEWASHRTLTGGAVLVCARALHKAKGGA